MKITLSVIFIFLAGLLPAQQLEQISFAETTHSFGTIKEVDGPVLHEFRFTNNGSEPITILNVKASCGCTTPNWSKEPVAPGETGFIQAQYNPTNRPGRFNKSLTVNNSLGAPIRLYINGEVTPRPRSIEESYPREIGAIRMKSTSLNMGRVFLNREPVTRKFEIVNQSEDPIVFTDKNDIPKYISLSFETDTLAAKATANVVVAYDGAIKDDLGFMNDKIVFYTVENGEESKKELIVYATIEEYFAPMSKEELEKAPKLTMEETLIDLGRIKPNQTVEKTVEVSNMGKSDLLIKKVYPNCTCLVGTLNDKKIKPGKSAQLNLTFDATGRRGNQQKSVTLYSNDPTGSTKRITIKAYIEN